MTQTKYEWRKQEKNIYPTTKTPMITTLPKQLFITITGEGNPNTPAFSKKVGALYALSYSIKMAPKKQISIPDYYDYTVFPLEGSWTTKQRDFTKELDKNDFQYKIMIKQPEFVTPEVFQTGLKLAEKKIPLELQGQLKLETIEEKLVAQTLHIGSYDSEPESFTKLDAYLQANNYERADHDHKEIYLSDPNKVSPDKQKTILRVSIREKN